MKTRTGEEQKGGRDKLLQSIPQVLFKIEYSKAPAYRRVIEEREKKKHY